MVEILDVLRKHNTRRHERNFERRVGHVIEQRERKLRQENYCRERGMLAVFWSKAVDHISSIAPKDQAKHTKEVAVALAERYQHDYSDVSVLASSALEIQMALANNAVSGIVLVGHGSKGAVWTDGEHKQFTWWDAHVAMKGAGLKRFVEKRTCDHQPVPRSIEWAIPVVGRPENYIAGMGKMVEDIHDDREFGCYFGQTSFDFDEVMERSHNFTIRHSDQG